MNAFVFYDCCFKNYKVKLSGRINAENYFIYQIRPLSCIPEEKSLNWHVQFLKKLCSQLLVCSCGQVRIHVDECKLFYNCV